MTSTIVKNNQLKYLEPAISVIFWLLLFASPILFWDFEESIDWRHIKDSWISFLPYLFLFLLNRFIFLPYLFFRNRRWLYFISNIILVLMMAVGVHYYRTRIIEPKFQERRRELLAPGPDAPSAHPENRPPRSNPPGLRENSPLPQRDGRPGGPGPGRPPRQLPPFVSFVMVSMLIIGFDTGLVLSVKWARSEQKRVRMEKENVENQLAFLRNQVSPHFFMNTLNNIHSLIDIDTGEAKDSIIKLSKLMRHLLYDSEVELIPLKKEIEFIQNYAELMKLRFSNKVIIEVNVPEQIPDKSIPPLLFTSFLENAFKHGINIQGTSFVFITFSFEEKKLRFAMRNSNPGFTKDSGHTGIGIENSRKRLDLLYGKSYALKIDDREEEFLLILTLPL